MKLARFMREAIGLPPSAHWSVTTAAAALVRRIRGRHLFVADLLAVALSISLALSVRVDGLPRLAALSAYLPGALLPLLVRPYVNWLLGLYRRLWRYASVPDLIRILWAAIISTVFCLVAFYFVMVPAGVGGRAGIPHSFWMIEMLLSLSCMGGCRFLIRAVTDIVSTAPMPVARVSPKPALLFGAGREGAMVARSALREPRCGVAPVGFLDDDPCRRGAMIADLPVMGGLEQLEDAVRLTGARVLLITMPDAPGSAVRRVMDRAQAAGLEVRTVPGLSQFLDGSIDAFRVRRVRAEDLLNREQVTAHAPGAAEAIRGRVVMVTGAGGSIGSELARQLFGFHPERLILVDRAESPLYLIQRELEIRALGGHGSGDVSVHLVNVASRAVIHRLVAETSPDVIFHAAACKHVPMMEEQPSEGVQVNIGGTMSMLDASVAAGASRFVLVSTDKAVEPTSVMGATKRLAEWLVADAAARTGRRYVSVRFGNVLGSVGSVLPIFQSQLENGEALTVTDPEMTRYFMTIQEAGWLILDAAAIGRPGDLFVLDMGEPVRIMDMVRDLVRRAGRDVGATPIRITGLRRGEKLNEKLFYDSETVEQTEVAKILRVVDGSPPKDVCDRARRLLAMAHGEADEMLRASLFGAITPSRLPEEAPHRNGAKPNGLAISART